MLSDRRLAEGDVGRALEELEASVRREPAEIKHRLYLFQLLSVAGQWERSLNQLNVLAEMAPRYWPMVQMYRTAIQCEMFRRDVFLGRRAPLIFGEPEPWMALLLESLRRVADGQAAAELRSQAFEQAPARGGVIRTSSGGEQDVEFQWIADADSRLGPVLEAVINGSYYWVPFQRLRQLHIEQPSDLRDLVWASARIAWVNEGETVALIPSRYPGSEEQEDGLLQLARKTVWDQPDESTSIGLGQRMLATDADDYSLLDTRVIRFHDQGDDAA